MRILIAGQKDKTVNYEQALRGLCAVPVTWLPADELFASCVLPSEMETDTFSTFLSSRELLFSPIRLLQHIPANFDGLLLPGGGDIHPGYFHQETLGSVQIDTLLDAKQLSLFYTFFEAQKPILGICKGMQIINVALGGSILQDLSYPARRIHAYAKRDQVHTTHILPDSFLYQLYGNRLITNSAHHQAVSRLGKGLFPAQYGPLQTLEGMFHASYPVLGVQWHPERMCFQKKNPRAGDGSQVLLYFLSLCENCSSSL